MNLVSHNKGKKLPPEPLSREEVAALLATCSRRAPTGIRDRALLVTLWRGQLRCSEALSLKPADFCGETGTIRVLHGKGDRSRVVVIDPTACEVIQAWLAVRASLPGVNGRNTLFCTLAGGPMGSGAVRAMVSRRGKRANISKRCHPHGLRHTGASELSAEGVPLLDIAAQLGHSHVSTTDRYLHTLVPGARAERIRARSW